MVRPIYVFHLTKMKNIWSWSEFQTVEQRGRVMRLHVDHYGGSDNGRTHAPIPFLSPAKDTVH